MAGTVDVGTGATVTHGTSSYSVEILDISGEISRVVVPTTHMGTTGAMTRKVGDLYDPGTVTFRIHFDPDEPAPYSGAEETVTVTFPIPSGKSAGAYIAGTGAVTRFTYGAQIETEMTGTYVVQYCDDVAWTDSAV